METEPEKPREETPAPSRAGRLASWFCIYLTGQVPLIVHAADQGSAAPFLFVLLAPLYFPVALSGIFGPLDLIWLHYPNVEKVMLPISFIFPYAFYLGHLYETLKARTRRRFDFLLLVLVIVVLLNQWIIADLSAHIRM